MEQYQQYLFHFNPYTKEWNAFLREDLQKYFNGDKPKSLITSSDIELLLIELETSFS